MKKPSDYSPSDSNGLRFYTSVMATGRYVVHAGRRLAVYNGLCECETEEIADMIANALNVVAELEVRNPNTEIVW